MNAHERQQFDVLLQMAVDRYAERLVQRNDGPETARTRLLEQAEADGVWLSEFVEVWFQDSLLDNTAGACFVLEALERRPVPEACRAIGPQPIGGALAALARAAFAVLLRQKTAEELARRAGYQALHVEPT